MNYRVEDVYAELGKSVICHSYEKEQQLIIWIKQCICFFFCLLIFKESVILSKEVKYKALYLINVSFINYFS